MSESRLPRNPPPIPQEAFVIREVDTGKSFTIREATDEQLAKHLENANQMHQDLTRQAIQMIGQSVNVAKAAAVLSYEIERRSKQIIKILQ
jgi:hypothetical protein